MKLNPEGVEKAVAVACQERDLGSNPCGTSTVEVIITAYFDHLREAGLMVDAVMTWNCAVIHNGGIHMGKPNAAIIRTDKD